MPKEVIISLISTVLGTVVGWILNCFSLNTGRIVIEINDFHAVPQEFVHTYSNGQYTEIREKRIIASFELLVTNKKQTTCGVNNCKVYLENKNGEKQYFTDLTEQMAVCYDGTDLLNIPGRTTKSKKIEKELMLWRKQSLKGSVICLEYRINGKKKIHRCMLGEMKE